MRSLPLDWRHVHGILGQLFRIIVQRGVFSRELRITIERIVLRTNLYNLLNFILDRVFRRSLFHVAARILHNFLTIVAIGVVLHATLSGQHLLILPRADDLAVRADVLLVRVVLASHHLLLLQLKKTETVIKNKMGRSITYHLILLLLIQIVLLLLRRHLAEINLHTTSHHLLLLLEHLELLLGHVVRINLHLLHLHHHVLLLLICHALMLRLHHLLLVHGLLLLLLLEAHHLLLFTHAFLMLLLHHHLLLLLRR